MSTLRHSLFKFLFPEGIPSFQGWILIGLVVLICLAIYRRKNDRTE